MVSETYGYGQPLANVFYYDVANSLADGGLKWESTAQTDFGVDMGVLKNRLTFTFDYFHKKTKDLLMSTPLPLYQAGLTRHDYNYGSLVKNIGAVENKGFEFVIGGVPVDQEDLTWNFNINFSAYKNRITDLGWKYLLILMLIILTLLTPMKLILALILHHHRARNGLSMVFMIIPMVLYGRSGFHRMKPGNGVIQ